MKYYRVAFQETRSGAWKWGSTPLTSVQAVSEVLRLYARLPRDRLRIFCSSSPERLGKLLVQENQGSAFHAYTVEQFLQESRLEADVLKDLTQEKGVHSESEHDPPYQFNAPTDISQALAWTLLLAEVRRGELEP